MFENISKIETNRISVNPNNPRTRIDNVDDLVASIKKNGLMQPITVRWTHKFDENKMPTGYEVIAGSRRLTACEQLGIETMPCIVKNCDDAEAFELATTENIVRENMDAADEAMAVKKMFDEGKSRLEIAATFGKSQKWAEGRRRIASLGDKALDLLKKGEINLGHAEALCLCEDNPEKLDRWLIEAKYYKPEDLKTRIIDIDRENLANAPFDCEKFCRNCPKRSDRQADLFGDVKEALCLDSECYEKNVKNKIHEIAEGFKAQGMEEISEDKISEARYGYGGYIKATSKRDLEDYADDIKFAEDNGKKKLFWITEGRSGIETGFAYYIGDLKKDDNDESENDEDLPECLQGLDWEARDEIEDNAVAEEKKELECAMHKYIHENLSRDAILELANLICVRTYITESENGESGTDQNPIFSDLQQKIKLKSYTDDNEPEVTAEELLALELSFQVWKKHGEYDTGIDKYTREKFCIADHETYLKAAREHFDAENKKDESNENEGDEE